MKMSQINKHGVVPPSPAPHRSFLEGPCWPSSPDCGSGAPGSCCVQTPASGTQQAKGAAPPLWKLLQGRPRGIPVHGSPRADIQGARREVRVSVRKLSVAGLVWAPVRRWVNRGAGAGTPGSPCLPTTTQQTLHLNR